MASIESRNGSWRVIFRYKREKYHFTVGEVSAVDAAVFKASTEELLRLLNRNLVSVPAGCSIEDFMVHRGKPPEFAAASSGAKKLTLGGLREAYFNSQKKKLEETTLEGIKLHFDHLERFFGPKRLIPALTRPDLQNYVDKRSEDWIDPNVYRKVRLAKQAAAKPKRNFKKPRLPKIEPPIRPKRHPSAATIRKEIVSLRTAWNWARRHLDLAPEFPGTGLDYPKIEEGLPFMTWDEAQRRIAAGDDAEKVWDCIYLRPQEIAELLGWVKERPVSLCVYPMFVFAAYTGARRSEIVRALPSDVDLATGVVTIREKKRDKSKLTTRRVPLTPYLKGALAAWLKKRGNGKTLFCKRSGKGITPREAHHYFRRAIRLCSWSGLKGWHVFRHSFISALASKGVDQRIIDDLVGHQTEQQRRRYRHLYPDVKQDAILAVFAGLRSA
ncbi:MAG TPA: tyrosine-type recombinase/integrase [Planctomycetaceae bacterium]|jgi:integrase|nr:tyrosine-type recombinase/integrase [Planctomycetaceae bacterium]